MKKIGQGLSYTVFDLGEGRVLKKPTFGLYKFSKLFVWSVLYRRDLSLIKKLRPIISSGRSSIEFFKRNFDRIDFGFLGNPEFLEGLSYSQDKVVVLREVFKLNSFSRNCEVIDLYVESFFKSWGFGFSDVDFNFMMNAGVSSSGDLVLSDINGICVSKDEVLSLIEKKVWLEKHSFKCLKDEGLKIYFSKKMAEKLTKGSLDRFWKDLD